MRRGGEWENGRMGEWEIEGLREHGEKEKIIDLISGMKLKIKLLVLILLTTISNISFSQSSKKPIDYRFRNGENGYFSFFIKNIVYPASSVKNGIIGNSITRISVNPAGEIDSIAIFNPVDTAIDREVLRVVDLSKRLWKKCDNIDSDQIFYLQVAFSLFGYQPNICKPKSKALMALFPEPVLIKIRDQLLPLKSTRTDSTIVFIKREELFRKLNICLSQERYEEALPVLKELIGRNPFDRELYKTRIMINSRLSKPELVEEDDNKLFDFAGGFSLNDINKDQQ